MEESEAQLVDILLSNVAQVEPATHVHLVSVPVGVHEFLVLVHAVTQSAQAFLPLAVVKCLAVPLARSVLGDIAPLVLMILSSREDSLRDV